MFEEMVWEDNETRAGGVLDRLQADIQAAHEVRQGTRRWLVEETADKYEDAVDRGSWWL